MTEFRQCANSGDCRYMHNGLEVVAAELAHYQQAYYALRESYIALYIKHLNTGWRNGYHEHRSTRQN